MYTAFLLLATAAINGVNALENHVADKVADLGMRAEATSSISPHQTCPPGFKNTVFNTDALQQMPNISYIWSELSSYGVSQFIAFALYPMWNTSSYTQGQNYSKTPTVDAHQFRMIGGQQRVSDALVLITNPETAPKYLELFNEPDLNNLSATTAAQILQPIFEAKRNNKTPTTLVGSPLATSTGNWSTEFYAACNNCSDLIEIQGVHSYHLEPSGVMADITHVHKQFPDKDIWLTETSPATLGNPNCTYTEPQIIEWMNTLIPELAKTGYVKKVFWNRGTYKVKSNATDNCDTSLVDETGKPRELLAAFQKLC